MGDYCPALSGVSSRGISTPWGGPGSSGPPEVYPVPEALASLRRNGRRGGAEAVLLGHERVRVVGVVVGEGAVQHERLKVGASRDDFNLKPAVVIIPGRDARL